MVYLQAGGLWDDLYWFIGALIVLLVVLFLTKRAQSTQRAKHLKTNDPRHNVVNTTSYNINEDSLGDKEGKEELTAEEARQEAENMKETGHIPSDEEFYRLRKDMKKDE
ncbi:hypothetical protein LEM8419_01629 [Neolewinella maritima]|uniref:SHOCT domain-containing protein n=1 Tax=Neolewinella maritima TaxID=1383882 RepID=A0ABM9B068_9BACT|nr:hypothetical protein [Neolewinella maritima]CAH1000476.1 hypothetical protein LEM8419_01629 [Neolewinella maritima]